MPNDYVQLDVPAGNGVGVAASFTNRSNGTVMLTGTWAGIVSLEGSDDGTNFVPIPSATFKSAGFFNIEEAFVDVRVRRSAIPTGAVAGTPVVTVGRTADVIAQTALPPTGSLNGAGGSTAVDGQVLTTLTVSGSFSNRGMVVYVEISADGACWSTIAKGFTTGGTVQLPALCAQFARQRIVGRTVAGAVPVVTIGGESASICHVELTMPTGDGSGAASDTSGCGPLKTIVCGSTSGDVSGLVSVEGSNDGGVTFVRLTGFNTTGVRQVNALCQFMRVTLEGFAGSPDAGLCVGVSSVEGTCDTPSEGASTDKIAGVGGVAVRETTLTLATPAGAAEGDLLIAALAITYAPSLGTSPVAPGNVAVIAAAVPENWTRILADFPGGNNNMTDQGAGLEEDRFAVFSRIVTAAEAAVPINHVFTWATGGGAVSSAGVIKAFTTDVPTFSPSAYGAAAVTIATNVGNPMNVTAPSVTPAENNQLLVTFYVARNGANPAPGGSTFSTPAGMADLSTPINLQAGGLSDPIGIAMFIETVTSLPTGTRTSVVTQDNVPSNPFKGMGYSLLISGCTQVPGPPPPPPG